MLTPPVKTRGCLTVFAVCWLGVVGVMLLFICTCTRPAYYTYCGGGGGGKITFALERVHAASGCMHVTCLRQEDILMCVCACQVPVFAWDMDLLGHACYQHSYKHAWNAYVAGVDIFTHKHRCAHVTCMSIHTYKHTQVVCPDHFLGHRWCAEWCLMWLLRFQSICLHSYSMTMLPFNSLFQCVVLLAALKLSCAVAWDLSLQENPRLRPCESVFVGLGVQLAVSLGKDLWKAVPELLSQKGPAYLRAAWPSSYTGSCIG